MKLIVVRHGETDENQQGILQGHMGGTLSREGIEQSKKLALRLNDEKINAIFSSDLKRASDTTKLIAKYHPNVQIEYTEKLREGDCGSWTGLPSKNLDWKNRPDDAETVEQMKNRAKFLLDEICEKSVDRVVLVVSHAGFIRCLIARITGIKDPFKGVDDQSNTSVNIFEIYEDDSHRIHCLNCVKHLEIDSHIDN